MREHKSRWSHSWSLLLMGMYIVQHTLAFLQHWRIVFFKAVNKFFQILHGKLSRKQKKKTKRLTSSSQLWTLFCVKRKSRIVTVASKLKRFAKPISKSESDGTTFESSCIQNKIIFRSYFNNFVSKAET